ncbi:MAG: copper amine oxidase N-terminal domain-containing protein [Clostridia bacterium]|nr:copper amine oxidase N-terminal domain-containing protein [Clostridia bacterium]
MKHKFYFKVTLIFAIFVVLVFSTNQRNYAQDITVLLNGKAITFVNDKPFVDSNGRTQVPFRQAMEAFGAEISWNSTTRTAIATKNNIKVEVPIGKTYIFRNKEKISSDTAAMIVDGRTYLPIRVVIEAFGGTVGWNAEQKSVDIQSLKNEGILVYNLPFELGMAKMTIDEVETLVGAEPEIIQEKISTVADLLQYMISAKYKTASGDEQISENGYTWHHNRTSESTIRKNEGNCGATANFANYILKDDYDEVGFINFSADSRQGGHIFNYIKQDDQYHIIDFLQYPLSDYSRYNYRIISIDQMEDYPEYCLKSYGAGGQYQIKIIVSYTSDEYIPIANKMQCDEIVMRYLPKDSNIKILYETPEEGKIVEFIAPPTKYPTWN